MRPEPSNRLSRGTWIAAARATAIVITCATVASMILSTIILDLASNGINRVGLMVSIVMPILLGTPIMFYVIVGRQRLKQANAELARLASTDWLTDCLNRRAFTLGVEQRLGASSGPGSRTEGGLLMIDADHFKAVNDRFGHEHGDVALQLIADAIRGAVRAGDLVGRVGGEEFGVFIENADGETVGRIAEGIRAAITARVFAPGGQVHPLSVSIGGATFAGPARVSDLFRLADARLYDVKGEQRGHVKLAAA